jgi:hypothetical protein
MSCRQNHPQTTPANTKTDPINPEPPPAPIDTKPPINKINLFSLINSSYKQVSHQIGFFPEEAIFTLKLIGVFIDSKQAIAFISPSSNPKQIKNIKVGDIIGEHQWQVKKITLSSVKLKHSNQKQHPPRAPETYILKLR